MKRLLCLTMMTSCLTTPARAGGPVTPDALRRMQPCELDQVFGCGTATVPVGPTRGRVLWRSDARMPRFRAWLGGTVWKGKNFREEGGFVNQWVGFEAGAAATTEVGTSWHDGRPCVVMEYPPSSVLFKNTRDELREVAPGLYLCRFYERGDCPYLKGYFLLELKGCR